MSALNKIGLQLILLLCIWGAFFFSSLVTMVQVWGSSETYKHCFFILPIVIYLFYERKAEFRLINVKPNYWLIIALIAIFLINVGGQLLSLNLIMHGSAYLSLVSIIWLSLGNDFVKRFWFPLFFLGFSVPFGEELVPLLQDITAYITVEFARGIGIPIYREGLYLYVPNGTFLVAEACAGIRFLIASFALGTLFAYLNYRTRWKFISFIGVSILVPIIANGIRAFGIVAIGYSTDMEHATGADHLVYGWFFFAFVLLLLFWLGQLGQENTRIEVIDSQPSGTLTNTSVKSIAVVVVLTVSVPIYVTSISNYEPLRSTEFLQSKMQKAGLTEQRNIAWKPMLASPHEEWFGVIDGYNTFIAYYYSDDAEHELVSGQNRYFNIDAYTRKSIRTETTTEGSVNAVDIVDVRGRNATLFYWFVVDGTRTAGALKTKFNQAKSKLAGNRGEAYFVAIEADNIADIEKRLATLGL